MGGNGDTSLAKVMNDDSIYKVKKDNDTESDEDIEEIKDYFWKTSLGVGSKFMTCSLKANKDTRSNDVRDEDNSPIQFYRDTKGRLVGSFFVYSRIPEGKDDVLAYHVFTSSKIPFKIYPQEGFISCGEKQ